MTPTSTETPTSAPQMKTREEVLAAIRGGRESACAMIDSRDYARLCDFMPESEFELLGFQRDAAGPHTPREWTRENIIAQMAADVAFGFEKALNKRGISANLMNEVVKMWLWILNDDLQHHGDYPQYGLPLLKAVAVKYGFPNEIGDDTGSEYQYSSGAD